MHSIGLCESIRRVRDHSNELHRRVDLEPGSLSPVELMIYCRNNWEPFRNFMMSRYEYDRRTPIWVHIDRSLMRWYRIYKPSLTVKEHEDLCWSLSCKWSAQPSSTSKSLSVFSDRFGPAKFKKRVKLLDGKFMTISPKGFCGLSVEERFSRMQEYKIRMSKRVFCHRCDCFIADSWNAFYKSFIHRKSYSLNGSYIKAKNRLDKLYGSHIEFCAKCHRKNRAMLSRLADIELINGDVKDLRKLVKENAQ